MKYRTLAAWQTIVLSLLWIAAIGAAALLVLVQPINQPVGPLVILLIIAPFVLALIASLPIMLNPRGAVRDATAAPLALANQNDAFSVVTGQVRTPSGDTKAIRVIVPTVFGPDASLVEDAFSAGATSSIASGTQHVAREETLDFALQAAREQHPNSMWVGEPVIRDANESERAQALRDGVNAKFVL